MRKYIVFGVIGSLLTLCYGCQPYEDLNEAMASPDEQSFATGTLNGQPWSANGDYPVLVHTRRGKIILSFYGIQSYASDLYWDVISLGEIPWVNGLVKANLNKITARGGHLWYSVVEYDVSVKKYELDTTLENYLVMRPILGSADYTGRLEVHLVKSWEVDYAPNTPDTLHLVIEEFRATRLK